MKFTKNPLLVTSIVLFASTSLGFGQNVDFIIRGNLGIGAEYETLAYNGAEIYYSPGGGMGAEVGLQIEVAKNFILQSTLGYQLNLALQIESFNGVSNESSSIFNRKFMSFGALKKFPLTEYLFNGILIGGGAHYNIPGQLKRIEDNVDLGSSKYKSNIGYYIELAVRLKISETVYLDPGIRYRNLALDGKSYSEGTINDLPESLQKLNANGVELGLVLVKNI